MTARHLRFYLPLLVLCTLFSSKVAFAAAPLKTTFSATLPSGFATAVKRIRVAPDGTVFVVGTSTSELVQVSSDGSTATSTNYNVTFPSPTGVDFVVSGNSLYIVTTAGSNGRLLRYDVSGATASLVASLNQSGTGAIALGIDNRVYSSRSSGIKGYDTTLSASTPTTNVSAAISRTAVGSNGNLYYISTSGVLRSSTDFTSGTDTSLVSGLGNVVSLNSLVISPDSSAAYIGYSTSIRKYAISTTPNLLWTESFANNLTAMDVDSSGNIVAAINNGTITVYSPINAVSSFFASPATSNTTSVNLNWDAGVGDSDFSGVTIRRSTSTYPTSTTDGTLVSSNVLESNLIDSDLSHATIYYYTIFNKTSDGFYSSGVTDNVLIPPSAPTIYAAHSSSNASQIDLSWDVPSGTDTFNLQRSMDAGGYTAVQTGLASSVTSYSDMGLADGSYTYKIFAVNSESNPSDAGISSTLTIDTTGPSAPISLAADVSEEARTVTLTWINPVTDFDSMVIRRSTVAFPTDIDDADLVAQNLTTTLYQDENLEPGIYYYSLFALDSVGNPSEAGQIIVTVVGVYPTVTTNTAQEVDDSGAILLGSVTDIGTSDIGIRGFEFGPTTSYGDSVEEAGTFGAEDFELAVEDLDCDTTYHYRAFATNETGTANGEDSTFTTSACDDNATSPLVVTVEAPTSPVRIGSTATFVVTVDNSNTSDSTDTVLSFTLSDNVAFVSAEIVTSDTSESRINASISEDVACTGTNPVVCNIGTVSASSSLTLNITVRALSAGPITVGASTGDSDSSGGSATTPASGGAVEAQFANCALNTNATYANIAEIVLVSALLFLWVRRRHLH